MELLKESQYLKVYSLEVEDKEINVDEVLEDIKSYFAEDKTDEKYVVMNVDRISKKHIEIRLARLGLELRVMVIVESVTL